VAQHLNQVVQGSFNVGHLNPFALHWLICRVQGTRVPSPSPPASSTSTPQAPAPENPTRRSAALAQLPEHHHQLSPSFTITPPPHQSRITLSPSSLRVSEIWTVSILFSPPFVSSARGPSPNRLYLFCSRPQVHQLHHRSPPWHPIRAYILLYLRFLLRSDTALALYCILQVASRPLAL